MAENRIVTVGLIEVISPERARLFGIPAQKPVLLEEPVEDADYKFYSYSGFIRVENLNGDVVERPVKAYCTGGHGFFEPGSPNVAGIMKGLIVERREGRLFPICDRAKHPKELIRYEFELNERGRILFR